MAQDLRELFKKDQELIDKGQKLKSGHKDQFMERLEKELPKKKASLVWLKVAATVALLFTAAMVYFNDNTDPINSQTVGNEQPVKQKTISLGDLSPDLKKVESYYVSTINLALSELELSQESNEMTQGFMEQLAKLNTEYESLNIELNSQGPNDQTITALIKNLQLRLQLLQKLKSKLNELKTSKNEQVEII